MIPIFGRPSLQFMSQSFLCKHFGSKRFLEIFVRAHHFAQAAFSSLVAEEELEFRDTSSSGQLSRTQRCFIQLLKRLGCQRLQQHQGRVKRRWRLSTGKESRKTCHHPNHNVPYLHPNFTMFMPLNRLQLKIYEFSGKFNVGSKCILLS